MEKRSEFMYVWLMVEKVWNIWSKLVLRYFSIIVEVYHSWVSDHYAWPKPASSLTICRIPLFYMNWLLPKPNQWFLFLHYFFLLLHYSFLINFVAGSMTLKLILRDLVELHCLGAFLVVATVDSSFQELQWFGNSVAGLDPIKKAPGKEV